MVYLGIFGCIWVKSHTPSKVATTTTFLFLRFNVSPKFLCNISDTRRVNLVTNPVISHERGKDREVFTTSGTYSWSFVTQIFHNRRP